MKLLLVGHKGYLGSYLHRHLQEDHEVDTVPQHIRYDWAINCIAKPDMQWCEDNPLESANSNWRSAAWAGTYAHRLLQFSSYYVYDDIGRCAEDANKCLQYNYPRHKLMGDWEAIRRKGLVFRLGKLFGNPHQRQDKFWDYLLDNSPEDIVADEVWFNPTSCRQVAQAVDWALKDDPEGVFNLACSRPTTHRTFALQVKKDYVKAGRPAHSWSNYHNCAMSVDKIKTALDLLPWQDEVERAITETYEAYGAP